MASPGAYLIERVAAALLVGHRPSATSRWCRVQRYQLSSAASGAFPSAFGLTVTVLYPSRVKGFAYVTAVVLVAIGIGVAVVGSPLLPVRTYGPSGLRFSLAFPSSLGPSNQTAPGGQRIAYVGSGLCDELGASVLAFPTYLRITVESFSSDERVPGTTVSHPEWHGKSPLAASIASSSTVRPRA